MSGDTADEFSWKGLLVPLGVLMAAPILDFVILTWGKPDIREVALILAVLVSFSLAAYFAHTNLRRSALVAKKMKPWNFGSIIFGMFLFLAVFKASGVPELITGLGMSNLALCVGGGFLLGIATGRIQVPASIVIPIYLGGAGATVMGAWPFAIMYASMFVGYIISPVHPCISVSLEYFGVDLKSFFRKMLWPGVIMMVVLLTIGFMVY